MAVTLNLHDLTAWHWSVAGAAIGVFVLVLQYAGNRSFGISTGFESLCALASRRPYFQRSALKGAGRWRLPFFLGLLIGGFVSAWLAGGWSTTWTVGRFDEWIGTSPLLKTVWMVIGGFFIGFGTRLAGGCTSGHGIFGIATLQRASFVSVSAFMASGIVTAHVLYRWVGGAA